MKYWGSTAFGPAHPIQIRVTNVNNNWYCRLCQNQRRATDSRRGREDKTRGTHTCDRPRGDLTLIKWTTTMQLYWLYLLKWQINWSRGKENTEHTSPSLSAVTLLAVSLLLCPRIRQPYRIQSLYPPGHTARVTVFGDTIKRTSCRKETGKIYPK